MHKFLIAAALIIATPIAAFAQAEKADPGSLSGKAKADQPGSTSSGSTATPTAKPEEGKGSLSDKAMKDTPGTSAAGSTANPTAEPKSGSLSDGAKKE
ncbi:MAG: hypothetical protein Q7T86_01775 [Hyphomicrobiaceae bacterium]|nr:hypothetical protein [Hyphomicrobiaceae bacterium]